MNDSSLYCSLLFYLTLFYFITQGFQKEVLALESSPSHSKSILPGLSEYEIKMEVEMQREFCLR